MAKPKRPTDSEIICRLALIKQMVASMKDAMPNARAEMMRGACEDIGDLMEELSR